MAKAPIRTSEEEAAVIEAAAADLAAASAFRRQIFFWLAGVAGLALFLYVFSAILLPFVAGMVLA